MNNDDAMYQQGTSLLQQKISDLGQNNLSIEGQQQPLLEEGSGNAPDLDISKMQGYVKYCSFK